MELAVKLVEKLAVRPAVLLLKLAALFLEAVTCARSANSPSSPRLFMSSVRVADNFSALSSDAWREPSPPLPSSPLTPEPTAE